MAEDGIEGTNHEFGEGGPGTEASEGAPEAEGGAETKEVEALAGALNHSAERVQTLWFSFLTFMVYLAVAVGTTTHRMLFLGDPLKLPFVGLELSLRGFYFVTPLIFVVFHFYMLLSLVLLARTAKRFDDALEIAFPKKENEEANENFRMRIGNTLFVQLLVGAKREREGTNALLLSWIALITLALAPIALLLMIQLKFLPYHSERITWWHRGLLAVDLGLVWALWPSYRSGWGEHLWPKLSPVLPFAAIISMVVLVYAVAIATFPDETMYLTTNGLHWIAPTNTLDLRGEGLINDVKLRELIAKTGKESGATRWEPILDLKERDFTEANLQGADIRHVDFAGATLNRANLARAWVNDAHLNHAALDGVMFHDASLDDVDLEDATLNGVQLQGASLAGANLQGLSFGGLHLEGASFDGAQLRRADFYRAHLQASSFIAAQLDQAQFPGAELQGAVLQDAQLTDANLMEANLEGALLDGVRLQGTSVDKAIVWRADPRAALMGGPATDITGTVAPAIKACDEDLPGCDWTTSKYRNLQNEVADQISHISENKKVLILHRLAQLDPRLKSDGDKDIAAAWDGSNRHFHFDDKISAERWRRLGCSADGAPYVARALLARLDEPGDPLYVLFGKSEYEPKLAKAFLDKDRCPGAHGLSSAETASLNEIAAKASQPAPTKGGEPDDGDKCSMPQATPPHSEQPTPPPVVLNSSAPAQPTRLVRQKSNLESHANHVKGSRCWDVGRPWQVCLSVAQSKQVQRHLRP